MSPEDKAPQQVDQLEGRYANYFQVGHNAYEFLLDFGQFYPESTGAQFHTRIVTGPVYAKALSEILQESIDRYEQTFGMIPQEEKKAQHDK